MILHTFSHRTINHWLFASLVLFVFSLPAFAQGPGRGSDMPAIGVLRGDVLDASTHLAVEYANITLIRLGDSTAVTGGITDSDGHFHIDEIPMGRYAVRIEFIGYRTEIISPVMLNPRANGLEQNLGEIFLEPSTLTGTTVEVTGERPLITHTIDKRIFNVGKNQTTEGGSAIEVMEQIPSVDVDMDGNISLRGSMNVKILIDGKPTGLSDEDRSALLEQLPATTIENIEIITNPSAKYDPDGMSGIINIILKRNRLEGLTGNFSTGYADQDRFNASGQLNYRNGKVNLSTMYAYKIDRRDVNGTNFQETFDIVTGDTSVLDQYSEGYRIFSSHTFRSSIDYSLNKTNTISLGATFSLRDRTFEEIIDYELGSGLSSLLPMYQRKATSDNQSQTTTLSAGWEKTFSRDGQNLKLEFSQTQNEIDETGSHSQDAYDGSMTYFERQLTTRDDERTITTIQADYVHPLNNNGKFEWGYKSYLTRIDNIFDSESQDSLDAVWQADEYLNTHFLFDEDIHATYLTYSQTKGLLSFQGGIRFELAKTRSDTALSDEDYEFENDYQSVFPSGHINYKLAQNIDVQASYSRRVNRPSVRAIVPITNYFDPLNIRTGNPYLLPEYIDSYEINYSQFNKLFSINGSLYYRKINDLIRRYKEIDDNGVSTISYINFDTGHSYGAEMVLNVKPTKTLKLMLSADVTRTIIDESGLDADINTDSYGYFTRMTATYTPLPGTDIQLFTMYRSPRTIAQGEMSDMLFANFSIKKSFWERKGSVSLQVSDVFDSRGFTYELSTENFYQIREREFNNRYVKLNFSYRFGKLIDMQRNRKGKTDSDLSGMEDMEID